MTKSIPHIDRVRYESFGGIVSSSNPPFLAWVDRDFMRGLGYDTSPLWGKKRTYLSAPTEVHYAVTDRCGCACSNCYMNAGKGESADLLADQIKMHLSALRDMGVFHVALGGGEAFERSDFGDIVNYCREIGLVPNLTTSGQYTIGCREIETCRMMGQVNVSLDGVGENYAVNGRRGSFEKAHDSIVALKNAGVAAGLNCVVSKRNFAMLERVIQYAVAQKLNEVEFLKFKPSGRGKTDYDEYALTHDMITSFYPLIEQFGKRYKIDLKIDCSFIPAMVYHRPPLEDLERFGVMGCDGGNSLMAVKPDGRFCGCSFVDNDEPVGEIRARWDSSSHLNSFRMLEENAQAPCSACEYLSICRCGCRATALYYTGDFFAPDPECPFVFEARRAQMKKSEPGQISVGTRSS